MKTILYILMAVSICFNIFFIAGSRLKAEKPWFHRSPEEMVEILGKELDMDEGQKAAYLSIKMEEAAERDERREDRLAQHVKLWAELIKDEPDPAVLEAFISQSNSDSWRRRFVERMQQLMAILHPEQRAKAAEYFLNFSRNRNKK